MSYDNSTSPIPVAASFVDDMVAKVEAGCNHLRLYLDVGEQKLLISAWDAGEPQADTDAFRTALQDFVDAIPGSVDPAVFDHKLGRAPQANFQAEDVRRGRPTTASDKAQAKARQSAHDDRVRARERARILAELTKLDPDLAQQVRDALG